MRTKMNIRLLAMVLVVTMGAVGIAGCGWFGSGNNGAADNYVVKLGYYNCDHMVAAVVAKDAGIWQELGVNVEVTGNGKVPEAMAAGQMDVGYIGTDGLMFAHMKGSPIFMAANNHIGGSYYLVASNSIQSPQDLVGKSVALGKNAEKSNPNWVMMAAQLGIPADSSQYKNVDMDLQTKYFTLKSGQLDAYLCCDPWGSMAEYEKTGHIMVSNVKEIENGQGVCCCFAMRAGFAEEHPDLAKKMLIAHVRSIQYIYLHPVKAAKIFAANYKMPEEVALMTIYKKTCGEGRTLNWTVDKTAMSSYFDSVKGVSNYANPEPVDKWVNTTLFEETSPQNFESFIRDQVDPVFPQGMSYEDWKKKAFEVDEKL